MKITKRQLRRIIREELEEVALEEVEPTFETETVEDAWAGGENLELPLDVAKVSHGADAVVAEPEVLTISELRRIIYRETRKLTKG